MSYDFQTITPNRTPWTDDIPGFTGNEGWYEDTPTHRIIFVSGVWWDDNKEAPWGGKGDIATVLDVWPRRFMNSSGHGGFVQYATMAYRTLESKGILTNDKPMIIAGHSLGAAVAAMLALRLVATGYRVHKVVLYACPTAWGRPKLRKLFEQLFPGTVNHVVGNDYVQFTNLFTLPLFLGPPCKKKHYKVKHKGLKAWVNGFIDDHWPQSMKNYIPGVTE